MRLQFHNHEGSRTFKHTKDMLENTNWDNEYDEILKGLPEIEVTDENVNLCINLAHLLIKVDNKVSEGKINASYNDAEQSFIEIARMIIGEIGI